MIDSILNFVFWFLVGWFVFNIWFAPMVRNRVEKKLHQLDQEIAAIKQVYKSVKIEEYSGIFYLFDSETDQFLGQGRTAEEFATYLKRDLVINIVEGEPDVIARFKATIPQIEQSTA